MTFLQIARDVAASTSKVEHDCHAREHGIKGIVILSRLLTVNFPLSFLMDFMHLVFENVLTTLVSLVGGTLNNLEKEGFVMAKEKWEEVGRATANSGDTIPSCFAARPPNFIESRQG